MFSKSLVPEGFYWARSSKHFDGKPTVVQVSTVFGDHPDFWTLALVGTEQHVMPGEFEIIAPIDEPEEVSYRQAAE